MSQRIVCDWLHLVTAAEMDKFKILVTFIAFDVNSRFLS